MQITIPAGFDAFIQQAAAEQNIDPKVYALDLLTKGIVKDLNARFAIDSCPVILSALQEKNAAAVKPHPGKEMRDTLVALWKQQRGDRKLNDAYVRLAHFWLDEAVRKFGEELSEE